MQEHPPSSANLSRARADTEAGPVAVLIAQHRLAEARLDAFEGAHTASSPDDVRVPATTSESAQSLLAYLKGGLETHIRLEEELLFPQLRQAAAPWDGNLIDQMIAGHDQIRIKRSDLQAAVAATNRAPASAIERSSLEQAIVALHQAVHNHFQSEEELVLRLVPELLSPDTVAAISRAITAAMSTMEEPDMPDTNEPQNSQPPLRGETTGTPERPSRKLAAPMMLFDLPAEIERLHQESGWIGGKRDGKTLVKEPDLHIVLTAMKGGTRLPQHKADARVSIQVLSGKLAVHVQTAEPAGGDQTTKLTAGHLLVLERNIPHDVDALVDSAFLLTLAWPERAEDALPDRDD